MSKKIDSIVILLIILYIVFFSTVCAFKYNSYGYYDYDLSTSAYTVYNILRGSIHNTLYGVDFLGNHAHFILFFVSPLYLFFKSPLLLLFLQTLALGLAAYPLYLMAKEELNKNFAMAIVVSYLLYPGLAYTNLFEFHTTNFAVLFLMCTFYFLKKEKFRQAIAFAILAMLCQENIALIIFMIGIYALIIKRPKKWVLSFMLGGISWFILCVYFIIPYFNKGVFDFVASNYGYMGNTLTDVAKYILLHPLLIIRIIAQQDRLMFLYHTLVPLLFLPLLGIKELLIITPIFMQHLLSLMPGEQSIYYHYTAEMIPFLLISGLYGLKKLIRINLIKNHQFLFVSLIIIFAILFNIHLGPQLRILKNYSVFKKDLLDYQRDKFLKLVPKDASVIATFEFLPKMVNRENLYSFHNILRGKYPASKKEYFLPMDTEYALVDFDSRFTFHFQQPNPHENLKRFFNSYNWEVVDFDGSTVLFKNSRKRDLSKLFQILKEEPEMHTLVNGKINDEIELIGLNWVAGRGEKAGEVRLSFYWRCLKDTSNSYNSFLGLIDSAGKVIKVDKKYMCYRIYPTCEWQKGEIIKEDYWYVLPSDLSKGNYYFKLEMFKENTKNTVSIVSDKKRLFDKGGSFIFLKFEKTD